MDTKQKQKTTVAGNVHLGGPMSRTIEIKTHVSWPVLCHFKGKSLLF